MIPAKLNYHSASKASFPVCWEWSAESECCPASFVELDHRASPLASALTSCSGLFPESRFPASVMQYPELSSSFPGWPIQVGLCQAQLCPEWFDPWSTVLRLTRRSVPKSRPFLQFRPRLILPSRFAMQPLEPERPGDFVHSV